MLKGNRRRYTFRILFRCLAWGSNPGFSSNKPTHYLLDHGDIDNVVRAILSSALMYIQGDTHPKEVIVWYGLCACSVIVIVFSQLFLYTILARPTICSFCLNCTGWISTTCGINKMVLRVAHLKLHCSLCTSNFKALLSPILTNQVV